MYRTVKELSAIERAMLADDLGDFNRNLTNAYEHALRMLTVRHGAEGAMFIRDAASETAIHLLSSLGVTESDAPDDFGKPVGDAVQTALMMALMVKRDLTDGAYRALPEWNIPDVQRQDSHTCSQYAEEIAMSNCNYGCKVYRCRICRVSGVLHSSIYGCRHPKSR